MADVYIGDLTEHTAEAGTSFIEIETAALTSRKLSVANLFAATAMTTAALFTSASTIGIGAGVDVNSHVLVGGSLTVPVNAAGKGVRFIPQLTEAASGTHATMYGVQIAPVFAGGSAATTTYAALAIEAPSVPSSTNAATLYIVDGASGATNNYALWAAGGSFRFDGVGPHAIGGAVDTSRQLLQTGTFTPASGNGVAFYQTTTLNALADQSAYGTLIAPTINEASSGVHALIAGFAVVFTPINAAATATDIVAGYFGGFTAPAGTTNASTIKINAAPTNATNNYALWVNSGLTRLGGQAETLRLVGADAVGDCYLSFYESDGTTSKGYVGYGSAASDVFLINNGETSNININAGGIEQVVILYTASATRYITLTGSNGGNPTIGTSAGSLAISSQVVMASTLAVTSGAQTLDVQTTAGATTANIQNWHQATSGDNLFMSFYTEGGGGTLRGSIDFNRGGTLVRYNTTSDERLKIDRGVAIKPLYLPHLTVHDFDWKETGNRSRGVFAQEAHKVFPDAISVGSDDLSKPWSASYSAYVPDLIVGWQDHDRRLAALEARLN